jgi:hypothetical protein
MDDSYCGASTHDSCTSKEENAHTHFIFSCRFETEEWDFTNEEIATN